MKFGNSIFKTFFLSLCIIANTAFAYAQNAAILPNAKSTFVDQNGKPLTSGTVDFYVPGTSTRKTTWQDSGKAVPNSNPLTLDAAGRALIWGDGSYREVVKDRNSNLIWDQVTSSAGSGGSSTTTVGDGLPVGTILPNSGFVALANYQFAYGQALSRSTYANLFAALTISTSIGCIGGSPLINVSDTSSLSVGTVLESICISGSPTIISKTSSSVTLSANSTITVSTNGVFFPYGNGDALTTFNAPDLRGYVVAGRCNMGGVDCSILNSTYFSSNASNTPSGINAKGGNQNITLNKINIPNYALTVTDPGHTHTANTIPKGTSTTAGNVIYGGSVNSGTLSLTTDSSVTGVSVNSGGSGTPISLIQPTATLNYVVKVLPDSNLTSTFGVGSIGGMTGIIACGSGVTCAGNTISFSFVGVNSIQGMTGNITCGTGISCSGNTISSISNQVVSSRTLAQTIDLSAYTSILTLGYYTGSDGGGAHYIKVGSQPFCGPYANTAAFQDLAGNWWDISEPLEYNIRQFGAKQDSIFGVSGTDDTNAVLSSIRCAGVLTGAGVDVGGGAGKIVRVPSGWSLISSLIIVPNQVPVIGNCTMCGGFDMTSGFAANTHFFIEGDQFTQTDIAASQSRGSAGNLTLNSSSQWYRAGAIYNLQPEVPEIYAASNNSGVNFTFTGTDRFGAAQTETIAGPTAGNAASSTKFWNTITQVATSAATVGNITIGYPQIATFSTRLQDLQLFTGNSNATQFTTSVNNLHTVAQTTGFLGNSMIYTNSAQHTAGLERVKVFAGNRSATLFEIGVGGASFFTHKMVESYNFGNCGPCASNNPQMYFNYAGLIGNVDNPVCAGAGLGGSAAIGIQVDGGFITIRDAHLEGIATTLLMNIRNVNNGFLTVQNFLASVGVTAAIKIDPAAVSNLTYVSAIFGGGATHTIDNKGVFTNVNVGIWTLF